MSEAAAPPAAEGRRAPGPPTWRMFHLFSEFAKDGLGTLQRMQKLHGDVVHWPMPNEEVYVVYHPDGVKHLLQDNYNNYVKGPAYLLMKPVVGEGLLLSEGDKWLRLRRLTQPPFHRHKLGGFVDTMVKFATATFDTWAEAARRQQPIDAEQEMVGLTLGIVGATLFSAHLSSAAKEVGGAVTSMFQVMERRVNSIMPLPLSIPTPANRRFVKAKRTLDGIVDGIIQRKKQVGPETENDMLSMLMQVRDQDTGEGMSDQQIHDSVMTMVVGGHETTANTLAWAWYLLGKNPEVVSKLQQELDQVLGGRAPTLEDLPKLEYLGRVIDEVLRLYPATWILARRALKDADIMGYRIPAKSVIYFSPYIVQHDPRYWEDPERFDPDRFLPERSKDRPRNTYFPFGLGPRQCIGGSFAVMEIQIVLALGLQRFRPRLVQGHPYEHKLMIVLRPRNGIQLMLEPREQAPSEGTKLAG